MYQLVEGVNGVHILGVVQSRDAMENLLDICPINPFSRYVLIEVGMQKETVHDILKKLKVQFTQVGARYLHEAITIALEDPETIERITKLMYPRIAKLHKATPSRVERAIRVATEKSWPIADLEYRKKIFGDNGQAHCARPTNTHYIEAIVQYLK